MTLAPDDRGFGPVADPIVESAVRVGLGLIPGAGPFLAEAVGLARAWHDDAVSVAEKAAIEGRFSDITRRLVSSRSRGV